MFKVWGLLVLKREWGSEPKDYKEFSKDSHRDPLPLSTKNRQEEAVLKTIIGWETPVCGQSNTFTSREGALTGTAPYQKKSSNLFFRGSWL